MWILMCHYWHDGFVKLYIKGVYLTGFNSNLHHVHTKRAEL